MNNKSDKDVNGWKLEIEFDRDIEIDQIWCSIGEVNGKKLIITPESYNSTISAGQSTSDIGFIIKSKGKTGNPKIQFK